MVGGLPDYSQSAHNPLRYAVTWSVDGLINDQMFINLIRAVYLTDEQFSEELTQRREVLKFVDGDTVIGCPLCGAEEEPADPAAEAEEAARLELVR